MAKDIFTPQSLIQDVLQHPEASQALNLRKELFEGQNALENEQAANCYLPLQTSHPPGAAPMEGDQRVYWEDLAEMAAMGLGHLPVASIMLSEAYFTPFHGGQHGGRFLSHKILNRGKGKAAPLTPPEALTEETFSAVAQYAPQYTPQYTAQYAPEHAPGNASEHAPGHASGHAPGHAPEPFLAMAPSAAMEHLAGTGNHSESVEPSPIKTLDVSKKLTSFFPSFFVAALLEIQSLLKRANMRGYVIGGIARDLMLQESRKLEVPDVDITILGDAIGFAEFLVSQSKNFTLEELFPEFGTARLKYKDRIEFDLASTRREYYERCASLPHVIERGVPLVTDIARRDFSVNTLALSLHDLGVILDFTNGFDDIEARNIRVLHPVSFFEDPSRILRAFRFAARLNFEFEPGTAQLMRQFLTYAPLAGYRGGGTRIKESLKTFLSRITTPDKVHWLERFLAFDGQRLFYMCPPPSPEKPVDGKPAERHAGERPEGQDAWPAASQCLEVPRSTEALTEHWLTITRNLQALDPLIQPLIQGDDHGEEDFAASIWLVFLSILLADLPEAQFMATTTQLNLTRDEREVLEGYRRACEKGFYQKEWDRNLPPEDIYERFHYRHPLATLTLILAATPEQMEVMTYLYQIYRLRLSRIKVELTGNDLMKLGVPGGERIGQIRRALLQAKVKGEVANRLEEIQFVQSLLNPPPSA